MKVRVFLSIEVDVKNAPISACRAVEFSLAQFSEQLEAVIADKLHSQFPDLELSFGAVEEER